MRIPLQTPTAIGYSCVCVCVWRMGVCVCDHMSSSSTRGSSTTDLILRRKVTASLPSIKRWSYVRATYIIGLISTWTHTHTQRTSENDTDIMTSIPVPEPYFSETSFMNRWCYNEAVILMWRGTELELFMQRPRGETHFTTCTVYTSPFRFSHFNFVLDLIFSSSGFRFSGWLHKIVLIKKHY